MQNAEIVLTVIRDRGKRGLPLEQLYRQLFNPELYLHAYGRLYQNEGAMTPGVTAETVDGMSLVKINRIIEALRFERYRWTPARRVHIPKQNGKTRPLGIPTWSDKLLQEVIRCLLEAYYEPQFYRHAHGFRPDRGCHTALETVRRTWNGTKWFIEGDIKGCFDNIDHQVLLSILRERIHDNRFLRLMENLLKAGYLEDWSYNPTLSGTPQGGIVSPLLSNIYLNKLDEFIANQLLPRYNRGVKRRRHAEYWRLIRRKSVLKHQGRWDEQRKLQARIVELPMYDPDDPDYRRLRYIRYADDFILGFAGPKSEAEAIKREITAYLRENLKLELSQEKTLITHATSQAARFLGYEIVSQHSQSRRQVNGVMALRVPADVIQKLCTRYMKDGKPIHRPELIGESDYDIIARYQGQYRGYVQYYVLAQNLSWFHRLHWIMETSLLKTLANKHKTSVAAMSRKHCTKRATIDGPRSCLQAIVERPGKTPLVATFGGIPLRYRKGVAIHDDFTERSFARSRSGLEKRLLAQTCELCGCTANIEVHHVRKLADLHKPGRKAKPLWAEVMISRQRKTLIVCEDCHDAIHAGKALKRRDGNSE